MIIPHIWEKKKCSKPPTSIVRLCSFVCVHVFFGTSPFASSLHMLRHVYSNHFDKLSLKRWLFQVPMGTSGTSTRQRSIQEEFGITKNLKTSTEAQGNCSFNPPQTSTLLTVVTSGCQTICTMRWSKWLMISMWLRKPPKRHVGDIPR